jgi:subtilase family serine protease
MSSSRRRTRLKTPAAAAAAAAATLALGLAHGAPAAASASARVALPNPTPLGAYAGTPATLASAPQLTLRVYLSGQPGRASAALAVSDPRRPQYGHYLTAAQFQRRYGATNAQVTTVSRWLTAQGMTVTATTPHYIAVNATAAEVDAAFATTVIQYDFPPITFRGHQFPSEPQIGTTGAFSVPAALGGDIAAVTGLQFTNLPAAASTTVAGSAAAKVAAPTREAGARPASVAAAADSYLCSQYWGQHAERVPAAYGRTSAPTQLCGYTPGQLRTAYGVSSSRYTGKGVTIAIVMTDRSPTMLADANKFFTSHGEAGFAPGQYTENAPASVAATCSGSGASQLSQDQPGGFDVNALEEALDVESVHITAPAAKVVYVAADCDENPFGGMQDLLDAATRVVDQHLANVVTGSFSDDESLYSPGDAAAWNLTFEQGAVEGIGFNLASGDGGANINLPQDATASVSFPSSSPWDTAVGGTTLEIGRNGAPVADYPWGDNGTQVDAAGTGYTAPPPGEFLDGSTGGRSVFFAEPAYQKPVVPAALATGNGASTARRVVPDIAANAEGSELIGYTGAVTSGIYGQILEGGTSASTPQFAGLEADAIQAAGHPLGFLNPALYLLHGSAAIRDVPPVNPAHPPVVIGAQPGLGDGNDYLTTLGEDQAPLRATTGYDDETGLGTPGPSFVTAFKRLEH